jgi:hypothetical protein
MIEISGRKIKIDGHEVILLHKVYEALETPFGVLVTLDWTDGDVNRNVLLLDERGATKWAIEPFSTHPDAGKIPYTGVNFINGQMTAYNVTGHVCDLDPATGKITKRIFTR